MSNREPTKEEALEMMNQANFEVFKTGLRLASIPFDEDMLELDWRLLLEWIQQMDPEEITRDDIERETRDFVKRLKMSSILAEYMIRSMTDIAWSIIGNRDI